MGKPVGSTVPVAPGHGEPEGASGGFEKWDVQAYKEWSRERVPAHIVTLRSGSQGPGETQRQSFTAWGSFFEEHALYLCLIFLLKNILPKMETIKK